MRLDWLYQGPNAGFLIAQEKGFYKLIGRVIADNEPALKLCQVMGWKEIGIHAKHGKLGSEWHDLVLAEYLISENLK